MSCCMLNFSRYFSSHCGIPLTIFTIISPNISSSQLYLVFLVKEGFRFVLIFYQQYFHFLQLPFSCVIFSWIDIFQVLSEIFFLLQDFALFPFEVVSSLFLLLDVLNYFTEITEVEKRAIQMYTNHISQNLIFYWQAPLYASLQSNNCLVNGCYPLLASL